MVRRKKEGTRRGTITTNLEVMSRVFLATSSFGYIQLVSFELRTAPLTMANLVDDQLKDGDLINQNIM